MFSMYELLNKGFLLIMTGLSACCEVVFIVYRSILPYFIKLFQSEYDVIDVPVFFYWLCAFHALIAVSKRYDQLIEYKFSCIHIVSVSAFIN